MRFDVLTLFPEIFPSYLGQSLLSKAIERELVHVELHNIRDWSKDDKHHKVDDRPYGGGPGMVLMVEPVVECVEEVQSEGDAGRLILFTPQGKRLDQPLVESFAQEQRLVLLCGRYEGFDQRIIDILQPEEVSIGDYVLSGGEAAAMVVIDAVSRLLPGVLGDEQSAEEDSFSGEDRLLEFAQYTRPREFRGHQVPDVLLSGNHEAIRRWRKQQSIEKTSSRSLGLQSDEQSGESQ